MERARESESERDSEEGRRREELGPAKAACMSRRRAWVSLLSAAPLLQPPCLLPRPQTETLTQRDPETQRHRVRERQGGRERERERRERERRGGDGQGVLEGEVHAVEVQVLAHMQRFRDSELERKR